ncbi:sigma factor [Micromonospora globispora]|uniref:sigma factor n=1 Tax=Micromonospora globispora TaxID=1450148 RepID=UPI001FAFA982|nr:sigma factor [Micromonospora globispora]
MSDRDATFAEYFAARSDAMRGTAYLLCGDWHRAEDLVQTAFTKLYLVWNPISRHEVLDAYVRQILIRAFLDERRRGWWRREQVGWEDADRPTPPDSPEGRLVMLQAPRASQRYDSRPALSGLAGCCCHLYSSSVRMFTSAPVRRERGAHRREAERCRTAAWGGIRTRLPAPGREPPGYIARISDRQVRVPLVEDANRQNRLNPEEN